MRRKIKGETQAVNSGGIEALRAGPERRRPEAALTAVALRDTLGVRRSGSLSAAEEEVLQGVFAGIAQLVEHHLAKVGVAGSSPVSRS